MCSGRGSQHRLRQCHRRAATQAAREAGKVVHRGVCCDGSKQQPLIGTRYHLIGHNYDLNEAEFGKLSADQKQLYEVIEQPRGPRVPYGQQGTAPATTDCIDTTTTREDKGGCDTWRLRNQLLAHGQRCGWAKKRAQWAAKFEITRVTVGSSADNSKTVELPQACMAADGEDLVRAMKVSPIPKNMQHAGWKDTFATSISGNPLTVTRTDTKSGGWGQELELEAVF